LTSWPCDELVMWRVDWQPLSHRRLPYKQITKTK